MSDKETKLFLEENVQDIIQNISNSSIPIPQLYKIRQEKLRKYLLNIKKAKSRTTNSAIQNNEKILVSIENDVKNAYFMYMRLYDEYGTNGTLKSILEKILTGVNSKNFGSVISKRPYLIEMLKEFTKQYSPKSINEMVYIVLKNPPTRNNCGKYPLFNTYELGYRSFCGEKANCECNRKEQSIKMHNIQATRSKEEKEKIIETTRTTCMKKYGVDNPMKSTDVLESVRQRNIEKNWIPFPV